MFSVLVQAHRGQMVVVRMNGREEGRDAREKILAPGRNVGDSKGGKVGGDEMRM